MILDKLKEYQFYTGSKDNKNSVSVSEVSNYNLLQSYLERTEKVAKSKKLSQATLGNIFDIGFRQLAIEGAFGEDVISGSRVFKTLSNGMVLSGECDLLSHIHKHIWDVKLSKLYAVSQVKKEGKAHQYNLQLNYYRLLYGNDYTMSLIFGLKDQSEVEKAKLYYETAIEEVVVDYIDNNYLIARALNFTNELKSHLDNGTAPDPCDDRWSGDLKCKYYCNVMEVCSYARKKGYHKPDVSSWLDAGKTEKVAKKQDDISIIGW